MMTWWRRYTWRSTGLWRRNYEEKGLQNGKAYGLQQSPRAWFDRFTKVILNTKYK